MLELFTWRSLLMFAVMTVADFLWAVYIRRTSQGKAFQAAIMSTGIMLSAGFVTIGYVANKWLLIPAALGCFVGTLLTVLRDHKEETKPEVAIQMQPVNMATDVPALIAMDEKIFPPGDRFDTETWKEYEAFWIILDGINFVGSMALARNLTFSGSWDVDKPSPGSLYVMSTALLPEFQGKGIGTRVKQWQINWARLHGFQRISTNCRASNTASLQLNQKFGFVVTGSTPNFYKDPDEATIVMELVL